MFKTQKPISACKDFQILSKLGEGAYSTVFKASRESNNQIYALKKVKMDALTEKERENALNEVRILASITDPFIVAYKEAFFDEESNFLCIVMEYAEQGDLQKRIKESVTSKKNIPEKEIWKCLVHISKALQTLHSMQILHRDLKSANVFITNEGFLKLGDMNVSKIASQGLVYTQTGTPYYASPEVWRDEPYDIKSDIWSLGCVLYEMAALKPPFQGNDMSILFKKIQKGVIERIPQCYSNELFGAIGQCLKVNPVDRPFAGQILKNPAVICHVEEVVGYKLLRKDSKVNLINKIEVPKNLAVLKERLPKPNYDRNSYADFESEEMFQGEKTLKMRVSSADCKRSELIDKSKLMNHLKNQNPNIDLKGLGMKMNTPLINKIKNAEQIQIAKNMNNINAYNNNARNNFCPTITRSPAMQNMQNPLIKSPSVGTPMNNLKLPSIVKVSLNNGLLESQRSHLLNRSPQMGIFNMKKNLDFLYKSPLGTKKAISAAVENELNQNKNINNLSIFKKQRLGLMRPNSQGMPQVIYNNNNNIISQRSPSKITNNDNNIALKPQPYGVINGSPAYKIVLKNRPLSHNSQRNNGIVDSIIKNEEQESQISEEKDIHKITNKLRPFSCNSNTKKFDQPMVIPHLINVDNRLNGPVKAKDLLSGLVSNNVYQGNSQKRSIFDENTQNTPKQTNIINNRALLYNQKPVTAPNIGRESIKPVTNCGEKNINVKNLYSKQALEMFEKNINSQRSNFSGANLGGRPVININNNYNYNLLPNEYYNK